VDAPRGRSSGAHRAAGFGDALDDAQREPVQEPGPGPAVDGVGGRAGGARKPESSGADADTRKANDQSKEKASNDGAAPQIVAPLLRPRPADQMPPRNDRPDGGHGRVDKPRDVSAEDVLQAASCAADHNQQGVTPAVPEPPIPDVGQMLATVVETAPAPPTNAPSEMTGGQTSRVTNAAVAEPPRIATAAPAQHAPPEAILQLPVDPAVQSQQAIQPVLPKGSDRLGGEEVGHVTPSSAVERAAARKRAADLLGTAPAASAKVPDGTIQSHAHTKPAATPHDVAVDAPLSAPPARQSSAPAPRRAAEAAPLAGVDTFVKAAGDSSMSHGDASSSQQHQPSFDDRRVRDALLAASHARSQNGSQPLTVAIESQASFARFIDGAASLQAPAPGSPATMATVDEQVIRGIQLQMRDGGGEVRIHLRPEHLGDVVVEMRVERDGVVATLRADTPAVRGWLAGHQDDLRAGLADVGLHLERLTVSDREAPQEQPRDPAQDEAPRRRRREQLAGSGRFEVEV
jgi:flagellar hook-length control protein FliK